MEDGPARGPEGPHEAPQGGQHVHGAGDLGGRSRQGEVVLRVDGDEGGMFPVGVGVLAHILCLF